MRRFDALSLIGTAGALLFIVCLYTSPAHLWPWMERLRPALLTALLMLLALSLRRLIRAEPIRAAGAVGGALVVVFALLSASALWARAPSASVHFALDALKLFLAFVGLASTLRTPWQLRAALVVAVLASLVPSWGAYVRWRDGIDLVEGFRAAWIGLLANPNQLAMVMCLTIPWALAMNERLRGPLRWLMLVAFALACTAIVLTHSRGGALGLAVALGAWLLLARDRIRAFSIVALGAFALAFFAPQSFWSRAESISAYELDASARGRLQSWETGLRALSESPLLGIGGGNYLHAWDRHMPRNPRELAYTAHNTWLEIWVELGLFGLAAFIALLFFTWRGLWRAREGVLGIEARALMASTAALIACGTTGGYAYNWFFYLALGLAGAVISQDRLQRRAPSPAAPSPAPSSLAD